MWVWGCCDPVGEEEAVAGMRPGREQFIWAIISFHVILNPFNSCSSRFSIFYPVPRPELDSSFAGKKRRALHTNQYETYYFRFGKFAPRLPVRWVTGQCNNRWKKHEKRFLEEFSLKTRSALNAFIMNQNYLTQSFFPLNSSSWWKRTHLRKIFDEKPLLDYPEILTLRKVRVWCWLLKNLEFHLNHLLN